MTRIIDRAIKRITLGDPELHQSCTVGMPDPQLENRLWLEGFGEPLDVTNKHLVACASPFTVGIGIEPEQKRQAEGRRLSVKFRTRDGDQSLLAEAALRTAGSVAAAGQELSLFHVQSCKNYCRAQPRLFAFELYTAFERWRRDRNPEIRISMLAARSMSAFFICPRPVVLVTATDGKMGNIFPMNLLGAIGDRYFAFALNSLRKAAPLVKRARRVALSSIPVEHADLVRKLGKNHRLDSADWDRLPFATTLSSALSVPVPQFALRVREMQIEAIRELGSHTLFFARLIGDERRGDGLHFCMIHGIYQAWRLIHLPAQERHSIERQKLDLYKF